MTNRKKHAILHVAIIDKNGRFIKRDTLETLRDWNAADVYDYTAEDTKTLKSWYDEDEAAYLERVSEKLAEKKESIVYDPVAELAFMTAESLDWWTHYLEYIDRFVVISQQIYRGEPGDEEHSLFDTLEDAVKCARMEARHIDKRILRVYVASDMHDIYEGGEIISADEGGFDSAVDA